MEHFKLKSNEDIRNDNNNHQRESLSELRTFSQHCEQVASVRCLKNDLEGIVTKVYQDIDRITAEPLPTPSSTLHKPLPNKQFTHCNSLLTDLLEVRHFRTIYNIFVVILMMLLMNTFVNDYIADGSVNIGLEPIRLGLGKFHWALLVWTQMLALSLLVFVMFVLWAKVRDVLISRGK